MSLAKSNCTVGLSRVTSKKVDTSLMLSQLLLRRHCMMWSAVCGQELSGLEKELRRIRRMRPHV